MILAGKTVAVVGNAESILEREDGPEIDAHDIVVRMNRGMPMPEQLAALGSRTDIVAGQLFDAEQLQRDRPHVWLMSPKVQWTRKLRGLTVWRFRTDWWGHLYERLQQRRPSTGIMVLYAVQQLGGIPTLYGFDWWQTGSHYQRRADIGPHDPVRERRLAEELMA